ncbi:MAG: hypothetical protein ACM3H7_04905, partial [Acidobacteriaceae bacterium]
MSTIHLISHTHWDREWYLPFEQFRLKLIHLLDRLLDILEAQPDFQSFLLDGQTILIEDYLAIRPEREAELRKYIAAGRIIIGPWYVSPDEFLVAPEALIRNLLEGKRLGEKYGGRLMTGYLPDTFGHIGQMPQILQGFKIDTACLWRGLSDQACELTWKAPDGSIVLLSYLRDSYSNAANLTLSNESKFAHEVESLKSSLLPYSPSGNLILMQGTDHTEPTENLVQAIQLYNRNSHLEPLVQSSLSHYFIAIRSYIHSTGQAVPEVNGELRESKHSALLQNVLSTRIDLKQRNHGCENDLLKWVEPFTAWAELLDQIHPPVYSSPRTNLGKNLRQTQSVIHYAWRMLMQCHAHDSICGTGIDQVGREMITRFQQVDQINQEIIKQSLERISQHVDTRFPSGRIEDTQEQDILTALVVFNPNDTVSTGIVSLNYTLPYGYASLKMTDASGKPVDHTQSGMGQRELINMVMDKKALRQALGMINEGNVAGMVIKHFEIRQQGTRATIHVIISDRGNVSWEDWQEGLAEVETTLADPRVVDYQIHAESDPEVSLSFIAREVPGHGYKTYWIHGTREENKTPQQPGVLSWWLQKLLPLFTQLSRLPLLSKLIRRKESAHSKPPSIL